ncbi:MAG: extracellular solute-binding protein, partial [Chloroflexota bacterium]
AIETWSEIWFNDAYVFGGRSSIVSTAFGDAPAPLFTDPPGCWLHRQANFITSFFPEDAQYGVDYDFFYLPPVDEQYGKPFLIAGDLMAMFNDRPEVRALMEYMTTPQAVTGWMEGGGAIAAQQTATEDMYGSPVDWGVAQLVAAADAFRFDGSDLMPGEVGSGSFWEQITSYVAGSVDLDTAMKAIDASWPEGMAGEASVTEEQPAEAMAPFDYPAGGFLEQAINGDFTGTTVTVDGAFEGNDEDGVKFDQSMAAFEDATGINVNYIGNKEFEASIAIRVDAGDAPDIVDFPQPGLYAGFVRSGDIIPVTTWMSDEWLSQQYNDGWREFVSVDGEETAVMHRYSGKSLVWYPKDDWDAAGYQIPETWDDLLALTQTIADDGDTAWCIGIESGAATGWPATDWTEDMMLRTTSLDNYDAWTRGELPFDSPEVKNAIETWSEIWFNDAYVFGGRSSIVSTAFGDAPAPLFTDPPGCWLHRQANFITSFFPEDAQYGVDYDFFYLPPVDEQYGKPFLIAGDLMAMFNDRPEVRALMEYMTTPQAVSGWLEGGGAIAAQQTATEDMYGSPVDWGVAQLVAAANAFRFDGSDLMPGEVGSGSFWEQITSYVAGSVDLDTAMQAIDASWPTD